MTTFYGVEFIFCCTIKVFFYKVCPYYKYNVRFLFIWSLIFVDNYERRLIDGAFRSDVNDFCCVACQVEFFFSKLMRIMGGVSSLLVFYHNLSHSLISKSSTCLRMVNLN